MKYAIINAVSEISKSDYETSKKFVLNVLNDLKDWETVDALALRVTVNLAKQIGKRCFNYSKNGLVQKQMDKKACHGNYSTLHKS